jgi:AcrR family transcriptional regulator
MVAAAITLFARAGFNGVTTKEIAQNANVSDGNIFRYFPTKRDLFLCALESELQKLSVRAAEIVRTTNPEDPRTELHAGLEIITRTMAEQPDLIHLLHFSALEVKPDIEPLFRQHVYPIFEALATHRKKVGHNQDSFDNGPMTTVLFFIATTILLQDFFPIFSGYPSPLESVESAATTYAELWYRVLSTTPKTAPLTV